MSPVTCGLISTGRLSINASSVVSKCRACRYQATPAIKPARINPRQTIIATGCLRNAPFNPPFFFLSLPAALLAGLSCTRSGCCGRSDFAVGSFRAVRSCASLAFGPHSSRASAFRVACLRTHTASIPLIVAIPRGGARSPVTKRNRPRSVPAMRERNTACANLAGRTEPYETA